MNLAAHRLRKLRPRKTLHGRAPWLAITAAAMGAGSADATLTILPLGDSLTYGQGSNAVFSNSVGYRLPLQQAMWNLGVDYDMVGGLTAGSFSKFDPTPPEPTTYTGPSAVLTNGQGQSRPLDLDHFGWPGAQAGLRGTSPVATRDLVAALQGRNQEPTVDFRQGNGPPYTSGWQDVNVYGGLIQQHGSDFHAGPNPGNVWNPLDLAFTTNPNASANWLPPPEPDAVLLHIGTNTISGSNTRFAAWDQFRELLITLQEDLITGELPPTVKIFTARILPKLARRTSDTSVDVTTLTETRAYNAGLSAVLNATTGSGQPVFTNDFKARIRFVDFFEIQASAQLAQFVGVSQSSLDPNGDGLVDWVLGGYNSATGNGSVTGANTQLWGTFDFIHPGSLGYSVMAYQWLAALQAEGMLQPRSNPVIPEPAGVAAAGVALLAASRRRRIA